MINVQDLNLSDSVVMGNVEQKITHISDTSPPSCPECGVVSGVIRVIPCSDEYCDNRFCDLCHPDCRYIDFTPSTYGRDFDGYITLGRFDSGEGVGAICELCINEIMEDAESEHIIWWQGEKCLMRDYLQLRLLCYGE